MVFASGVQLRAAPIIALDVDRALGGRVGLLTRYRQHTSQRPLRRLQGLRKGQPRLAAYEHFDRGHHRAESGRLGAPKSGPPRATDHLLRSESGRFARTRLRAGKVSVC